MGCVKRMTGGMVVFNFYSSELGKGHSLKGVLTLFASVCMKLRSLLSTGA